MSETLKDVLTSADKPDEKPDGLKSNPNITWTGGYYSGKAFRVHFVLLCLLTLACYVLGMKYGAGLYHMLGNTLSGLIWFWVIVQIVPIILWCRYLIMYLCTTKVIHYELQGSEVRDVAGERITFPSHLLSYKGVFNKSTDTLQLFCIRDLKIERTLFNILFCGGIGTVIIYSSDPSDPMIRLENLDHPKEAFDTLNYLYSDLLKRKGVRTMGSTPTDAAAGEAVDLS